MMVSPGWYSLNFAISHAIVYKVYSVMTLKAGHLTSNWWTRLDLNLFI